jgi:hypothetical protein
MVIHAVAHLFADGDLAGGLRNLWDIDRMLREFAEREGFWDPRSKPGAAAPAEAAAWPRAEAGGEAVRERRRKRARGEGRATDRLFERRLLARNGWGQGTRAATRLGFYIRSHWLRMPPLMLARHLWTKARR